MTQHQDSKKLHGKKRSYFFKKSNTTKEDKKAAYLTITSSKRSANGQVSRKNIVVFEKDLSEFIDTLKSISKKFYF